MIKIIRWCGTRIETESVERIRRHVAQSIVLHDQVAEAIEDRLTVVDLDAHQDMRPVRREDIGAGVDATPREIADEIGLFNDLGAVTDDMLSRLAKQASAPRGPRKFGSLNTARRRDGMISPQSAMLIRPCSAA